MSSKRKRLGLIVISIILASFSAGWIIRGFSEGGNPTIDPLGIFNMPWFNATVGVYAPEFYHEVLGNYTSWVESISGGGGVTDHGALTGLSDNDHNQYLFQDGSEELAGDWDAGSYGINASWVEASEFYLNSEDITDLLAYPELPTSYVIYTYGSLTYAKNGSTGLIDYSDSNASVVVLNVLEESTTIYLKGPMNLKLNNVPINSRLIGVGYVTIETSGGGANVFIYGADSTAENIYFHENNNYYHTITHTDQLAFLRFWTDFPHNGGSITATPEMIWDGSINTENAGFIRASFLWVEDSGTPYGIDVTTNGRLHVYNIQDGKKTQNMGVIGITGAVNSVVVEHQLTGSPNVVLAFPSQSDQGNLWGSAWNATHITLSFTNQPGGSTYYFWWWVGI